MAHLPIYSAPERLVLWCVALCGFSVLNVAFVYGLLFEQDALTGALTNPLALAFIVEALLMMCVLAWLLGRWRVARLHWGWFIVLSLLGSMAFALPVVLLWRHRDE